MQEPYRRHAAGKEEAGSKTDDRIESGKQGASDSRPGKRERSRAGIEKEIKHQHHDAESEPSGRDVYEPDNVLPVPPIRREIHRREQGPTHEVVGEIVAHVHRLKLGRMHGALEELTMLDQMTPDGDGRPQGICTRKRQDTNEESCSE
jgi:hypothetical protein